MPDTSHCAKCGAPLPPNWPKGLCSRCALEGALELSNAESQVLQPEQPPPNRAVVPLLREGPGDKIGHYKLLQQIGEGGCGIVYMAEQEEPVRRRVALKVIKLGMDTKQVIARFEAERQALALMDHPNIARVFDAGATDAGRPYFVMELVRGIKITDYCDDNNLSTRERLDLFAQVCKAIQHAHQKGIIHRDIKPSNILVTVNDGVPVPKVIDFGVAKATQGRLTDQTLFTAFEQFIGTPAYMSPEQAVMTSLDIDTRSDIYSLGVLLYELLIGKTPFDTKELLVAGLDEMRRTIREKEPARPSTRLSTLLENDLTTTAKRRHTDGGKLIHLLRGDLDWIVMKCLEKDRTRRYETANGLAADIQRHLSNEPITARPPSATYRFQKLIGRNKAAFAAAAAVAVTLVFGVVVSTWQAIRATSNEKKAATEAARSAHVVQMMKEMLEGVGPAMARGQDTKLLRSILDEQAKRLDQNSAGDPAVEAELRETLGIVYRELEELPKAEAMLRKSLELLTRLYGSNHASVASSLQNLGWVFKRQRNASDAEVSFQQALAIRRSLFGTRHPAVADSIFGLAEVLRRNERRNSEAERLHLDALAMRRACLPADHPDVATSLTGLAITIAMQGKWPRVEESVSYLQEALRIRRKIFGDTHPDVAYTLGNLGIALSQLPGKIAQGETVLREARTMQKNILGNQHETVLTTVRLAGVLEREGKQSDAQQMYQEVLTMHQSRAPDQRLAELGPYTSALDFFVRKHHFDEARAGFAWLKDLLQTNSQTISATTNFGYSGDMLSLASATAAVEGWPGAAQFWRNNFDRYANDPIIWRAKGTVFAYLGDGEWYRRTVTNALRLAASETNWLDQLAILQIAARGPYVLTPADIKVCDTIIEWVEREMPNVPQNQRARGRRAIGATLLRLGRLNESLAQLQKDRVGDLALNLVNTDMLTAICLGRLGRQDEARLLLEQAETAARKEIPEPLGESEPFLNESQLFHLILRREARAAILRH